MDQIKFGIARWVFFSPMKPRGKRGDRFPVKEALTRRVRAGGTGTAEVRRLRIEKSNFTRKVTKEHGGTPREKEEVKMGKGNSNEKRVMRNKQKVI
jgi:hypothetical protein